MNFGDLGRERKNEKEGAKVNKSTIDLFVYALGILFGFYCIIFHNILGRKVIEYQSKFSHLHFNAATEKRTQIIVLIVGMFFVIFGVLVILKIIK